MSPELVEMEKNVLDDVLEGILSKQSPENPLAEIEAK